MLTIEPLTIKEASQRWPAALVRVWDFRGLVTVTEDMPRPGLMREHVIDLKDGWRLIVSNDLYDFGQFIHVSASVWRGSVVYKEVDEMKMTLPQVCGRAQDLVREIGKVEVVLGFVTPVKLVPHFFSPALPVGVYKCL